MMMGMWFSFHQKLEIALVIPALNLQNMKEQ